MMYGSDRMAHADTQGGMDPRFIQGVLPAIPRAQVLVHRGEPIFVLWYAHTDGEAIRSINRVETEGDRIARIHHYFFTPEVITEVCRELGLPCRVNGYRHCHSV
jgi:RNA polymerase sigma-70 factor (ECF subfamily)